jgi:hypothetical protein
LKVGEMTNFAPFCLMPSPFWRDVSGRMFLAGCFWPDVSSVELTVSPETCILFKCDLHLEIWMHRRAAQSLCYNPPRVLRQYCRGKWLVEGESFYAPRSLHSHTSLHWRDELHLILDIGGHIGAEIKPGLTKQRESLQADVAAVRAELHTSQSELVELQQSLREEEASKLSVALAFPPPSPPPYF